jgi:hypothetical protein
MQNFLDQKIYIPGLLGTLDSILDLRKGKAPFTEQVIFFIKEIQRSILPFGKSELMNHKTENYFKELHSLWLKN